MSGITKEEAITILDNLHLIGCGRNQHEDDLKINAVLDMLIEALQENSIPHACRNCGNHPKNGGNGICNCILGGIKINV